MQGGGGNQGKEGGNVINQRTCIHVDKHNQWTDKREARACAGGWKQPGRSQRGKRRHI